MLVLEALYSIKREKTSLISINLFKLQNERISNFIKIEYYNYLSTPSGKRYNLKELTNKEYLVLLKFLNGENYKGFYNALDKLILESIPDFLSLDICDKAYIYIAYYFYSIRSSIAIKGEKIDSIEVPLNYMLDSIETNYIKDIIDIKFHSWKAKIHYPTKFIFDEENTLLIDFLSGLRSIENIEITSEQLESLRKSTPTKLINEVEHEIKKNLSLEVEVAKNLPGVQNIVENILNPSIFYSIAFIYKELLDNFYNMQYLLSHYVRVDWESLLNMTPIETTILYKNFIEDKEKQNEKSKGGGKLNVHDPNVADTLMGY